jgi:hypothetical protein
MIQNFLIVSLLGSGDWSSGRFARRTTSIDDAFQAEATAP